MQRHAAQLLCGGRVRYALEQHTQMAFGWTHRRDAKLAFRALAIASDQAHAGLQLENRRGDLDVAAQSEHADHPADEEAYGSPRFAQSMISTLTFSPVPMVAALTTVRIACTMRP